MVTDESVDKKTLKYVLYARRSTKADGQQQRSLKDQIRLCKEVADRHELNIVATVREKESAKTSFKREKFTQMLKDVKSGKYNGIICLHPDRLARNMLEAGMLIDMLDDGSLQDITFQAFEFTNDDNGKMMLGMLFVFSKQYSDNLSKRVTIGVRGNFDDGKSSGTPRHGYTRNKDGFYEPNEFFELIQEAWSKRLAGETLQSITDYLFNRGYVRKTKAGKLITLKVPAVSEMFREPFYYGLMVQAGQTIDMRKPPFNEFQPMVTEEVYNEIQALGYSRTKDRNPKKNMVFFPLRGMVYCGVCNDSKYMKVGRTKPANGSHVLSYRCDNPKCTRKYKSMRAHYIFDSIYEMLDGLHFTDESFKKYSDDMDAVTEEKLDQIRKDIQSKKGAAAHIQGQIKDISLSLARLDPNKVAYRTNEAEAEELSRRHTLLEDEIKKLEKKVAGSNIKVNKEEFLNLVKTLPDKMRKGNSVQKDVLAKILFLNLRVDDEKVVDYLWNEPFASLVKYAEFGFGGAGRN